MESQQLQKEVSSLSKPPMWTKANEKKTARKRHARNFTSGHVKVEEYHLFRTGIRGRKRWLIWTGLAVLLLIAMTNLVLNCFLIAVLQLGPNGLPYMIFMQNNTVIFPKLVNVSKTEVSSKISGFYNLSLDIGTSTSDKISLHSGPFRTTESISTNTILNPSQIVLGSTGIIFKPFESFKLYNASSSKEIMSLNKSMIWFASLSSVKDLHGEALIITNVQSTRDLNTSGSSLLVTAANAMRMTASKIDLNSHDDMQIGFKDPEASFVIKSGLLLSNLPDYTPVQNGKDGYRLCICGNGKVFRVPSNNCAIVNEYINPCS